MPKEHKFFEMFATLAVKIQEGVGQCEEMVNRFDDLEGRAKRIKDVEHDCDQITHETLAFLNSTFITPFDRQHIHALVTKMDDVMDHVDSAVQLLVLYRIAEPTEDLKHQVRLVKKSVDVMARAVAALEHMKKTRAVLDCCVEINTLENEGDVIMQHGMARLFDDKTEALQVIKWKGIHENFEDALDACEDVANVIETVVLENA
jgi:hypothetical protein